MNDIVYVIVAEDHGDTAESWVHCVCKDELTAKEICATINAEDKFTEYHVEEHEVY